MAGFYELLAQHYDSIFPAEPAIVDVLSTESGAGSTTGNHAREAAGEAACVAPGHRVIDAARDARLESINLSDSSDGSEYCRAASFLLLPTGTQ
ncbi:MAG: hypothetical protein GVY23_01350 [Spirochaetes bacterium]|jgi:hypothetical protein|nr:hypothetical protein [Spirochaetota bacterium]